MPRESRTQPPSIFLQPDVEEGFFDVQTKPKPNSFGLGRVPFSAKYRDEFGNVRQATPKELSQINVYGIEEAGKARGFRAARSPKIITDISMDVEKYTGRAKQ